MVLSALVFAPGMLGAATRGASETERPTAALCFANPSLNRSVAIAEPRGPAPLDGTSLWVVLRVTPYRDDARRFVFEASASPAGAPWRAEALKIDKVVRLSSLDAPAGPQTGEPQAFWLLRVTRPHESSQITLWYSYSQAGTTASGAQCWISGGSQIIGTIPFASP